MTPDREIHEDIKQRLKSVGSSFSKVARELGVTHTTVTTVSMGYRTSAKVQLSTAEQNPATGRSKSLPPERLSD